MRFTSITNRNPPEPWLLWPLAALLACAAGCATLPDEDHEEYRFPEKHAFIGEVERPHEVVGAVRERVDFPSLMSPDVSFEWLCRNYFNRAVEKLVRRARRHGGHAVKDVRSVVFLMNGQTETYSRPECADDGAEGQVLVRGVAIRWKPKKKPASPGAPRPEP